MVVTASGCFTLVSVESPKNSPTTAFSTAAFISWVAESEGDAASACSSAASGISLERVRNMSTSRRHSWALVACASTLRMSRTCSATDAGTAGGGDGLSEDGGRADTPLEDTRAGTGVDSTGGGDGSAGGVGEGTTEVTSGDAGGGFSTCLECVDGDSTRMDLALGSTCLLRAESESFLESVPGELQKSDSEMIVGMGGTRSFSLIDAIPFS